MQRRQIPGDPLVPSQALARLAGLGIQAHTQRRHRNHTRQIDDETEHQFFEGQVPGEDRLPGYGREDAQVAEERDPHEEQGTRDGHVARREALGQEGSRHYVDEVEKRVPALGATRGVDEQGDQHQVNADLDIGEADRILDTAQPESVGQGGHVGRGQQGEHEPPEGTRERIRASQGEGQNDHRHHEHGGQRRAHEHQVGDGSQRLPSAVLPLGDVRLAPRGRRAE